MAVELPERIGDVFAHALAERPDATALITRSRRLSYAELETEAARAANALLALGVRPGDRVAASLPQDADVVLAFHGAMRIGAIWVGVNRALAPPEKAYLLDDCGATTYLCDAPSAAQLGGLTRARLVTADGTGDEWRHALAAASTDPADVTVDAFAPAGIAYTSGTTGHPKGAVHSQYNLLLAAAAGAAARGYGPELRKGDCLPLTILNMLVLSTLLTARAGGCSIVMDRIDAAGVAEWIRRERVTTFNAPPALLHSLTHDPAVAAGDLASLRDIWAGGSECPERLRQEFAAKFGRTVLTSYGLSEVPTLVSADPVRGPHREGACGRPMPQLRVRIAAPDGRDVPAGTLGEVCVSAAPEGDWAGLYRPMLGYWQRPEATADALRGNELRTGDIGLLDADGWLAIRDRTSLMILRGSANVYPAEVERVLSDHPAVVACAVVGVPDERLGERVAAVVQPVPGTDLTPEELRTFCLASLARYKVPERFAFVDDFARNAMGKIVRGRLGDLFR